MGSDLRDRAERGLPALPEQRPLGGRLGLADRTDRVRACGFLDLASFRVDARLDPVHLDEQHGGGVGG